MEELKLDLQVHLFSQYSLSCVLRKMEERGLDGVALLDYSWDPRTWRPTERDLIEGCAPFVLEEPKEENVYFFRNPITGKRLCLILGQEVAPPHQECHILSVGALGIGRDTPGQIIEDILAKGGLPIIDHPFADPQACFRDIDRAKTGFLYSLCQEYRGRIALEWNGYCIPFLRRCLRSGDVNRKVNELGRKLKLPVVPTSDLHATNKRTLGAIGTAYIDVLPMLKRGSILPGLRDAILQFQFNPHEEYVSVWHFMEAFAMSYVKSRWFGY